MKSWCQTGNFHLNCFFFLHIHDHIQLVNKLFLFCYVTESDIQFVINIISESILKDIKSDKILIIVGIFRKINAFQIFKDDITLRMRLYFSHGSVLDNFSAHILFSSLHLYVSFTVWRCIFISVTYHSKLKRQKSNLIELCLIEIYCAYISLVSINYAQ